MASQYELCGRPLPSMSRSPPSIPTFDFRTTPSSTSVDWSDIRPHRSDRVFSQSRPGCWDVVSSSNAHTEGIASPSHSSQILDETRFSGKMGLLLAKDRVAHSPPSPDTTVSKGTLSPTPYFPRFSSTPCWDSSSYSDPSPAISPPPSRSAHPSQVVKQEEPISPKFVIEPLLPACIVTKRSSSSSPEPVSSPTQAELETQLLLSQSLAPPTEVPLRATQACYDMRLMMRSFRLNPFSIVTNSNGKETRSDSVEQTSALTWCGEIAKPLEDEPLIFEWQIEGYNNDIDDDLSGLISLPDDVQDASDTDREDISSYLEDGTRQANPRSANVFDSSLLVSEGASNSGFSTAVEASPRYLGRIPSFSMHSNAASAPRLGTKNEKCVHRAGSYDSGYESNNSWSYDNHSIDRGNFLDQADFSSYQQHSLPERPLIKKPRLSTPQKEHREVITKSNASGSQLKGYQPVSCPSIHKPSPSRHAHRKTGSIGNVNISHYSKAASHMNLTTQCSPIQPTYRQSTGIGSPWLPSLLHEHFDDSEVPRLTNGSSTQPTTPRLGDPSTGGVISSHPPSPSCSTPFLNSVPSALEVMSVAKIWATAANSLQDPDRDLQTPNLSRKRVPSSKDVSNRSKDPPPFLPPSSARLMQQLEQHSRSPNVLSSLLHSIPGILSPPSRSNSNPTPPFEGCQQSYHNSGHPEPLHLGQGLKVQPLLSETLRMSHQNSVIPVGLYHNSSLDGQKTGDDLADERRNFNSSHELYGMSNVGSYVATRE